MQVFTPFINPLSTAEVLDKRRLHKQVIECSQILDAVSNTASPWHNHPVVRMYADYTEWLTFYMKVLYAYERGNTEEINRLYEATSLHIIPPFLTSAYIINMRRRLYTKSPEQYKMFEKYGPSFTNVYFVDGKWQYFKQKQ